MKEEKDHWENRDELEDDAVGLGGAGGCGEGGGAPGLAVPSMASSPQILNVRGQHLPHTSGTGRY